MDLFKAEFWKRLSSNNLGFHVYLYLRCYIYGDHLCFLQDTSSAAEYY